MWCVDKDNDICININWIEAMAFHDNYGWVYFPWGNDILKMTSSAVDEIQNLLKTISYDKRKLRLFHEFKNGNGNVLIDLSEIKVIRKTDFGIIFYRRYVSEDITNENIARYLERGEVYRANKSEWDDCCAEVGELFAFSSK